MLGVKGYCYTWSYSHLHNIHKRKSMTQAEFKLAFAASQRPHFYAFERTATEIGLLSNNRGQLQREKTRLLILAMEEEEEEEEEEEDRKSVV